VADVRIELPRPRSADARDSDAFRDYEKLLRSYIEGVPA
jgi:hypothetical protein